LSNSSTRRTRCRLAATSRSRASPRRQPGRAERGRPNAGFFNSQIIQAFQWAVVQDHVNVLNESIGANPLPNTLDTR